MIHNPVGADVLIRPSAIGFLHKPNGDTQSVGAIHESPENGWIFHKPNGELQSVGVADLGDPRAAEVATLLLLSHLLYGIPNTKGCSFEKFQV